MDLALERTSWRALRVDHPADWELVVASAYGEPVRCVFGDRHFQRMELRWRKVKETPNLALMLEKHRLNEEGQARELTPTSSGAPGWYLLLRKTPPGCTIHAAKALPGQKVLIEATVVWPERRDAALESAILASVAVEGSPDKRLWQAMGISLELSGRYELRTSTSTVGRVTWEFAAREKAAPQLTVERLAMPGQWLKGAALRDWLVAELPPRHETIDQTVAQVGSHRASRLLSRGKVGGLAALRGIGRVRLDLAWQCEIENRIYRMTAWQLSKERQLELPGEPHVTCCRPVAVPTGKKAAR